MNRARSRTPDDASWSSASVRLYRVALFLELGCAFRAQLAPDELRRVLQSRIVLVDLHLRHDRRNASRRLESTQRILERLLDHVADPSGRRSDEHAERHRWRIVPRELVADELIANLRSVAVDDAHVPSVEREIDD